MKSENFVGYLLKSANNGHGHGQDKFASNGYYESINKCMKKIYIYIPGTQMTLVLIGTGRLLEGSTANSQRIGALS